MEEKNNNGYEKLKIFLTGACFCGMVIFFTVTTVDYISERRASRDAAVLETERTIVEAEASQSDYLAEARTEVETEVESGTGTEAKAGTKTDNRTDEEKDLDYLDYRDLDKKFTEVAEGYSLPQPDKLFDRTNDPDLVRIPSEQVLNATPGTILAEGNDSKSGDNLLYSYAISVPEIRCEGLRSDAFSDYVVIEVFSYYESQGMYDEYGAESRLYLFDKRIFEEGYDLTADKQYVWFSSVKIVGPAPTTNSYYFSSGRVPSLDELEGVSSFSYRNDENVTFSKNSIDFDQETLDQIVRKSEAHGTLFRYVPEELYSYDVDGTKKFDLERLLDPYTGALGEKYELHDGYNGWIFIYVPGNYYVIGAKNNQIWIGASARKPLVRTPAEPNPETDKLYAGRYYYDSSDDPEMVELDYYGTTLTQSTLDQLLYLLMDAGIDWGNLDPIP